MRSWGFLAWNRREDEDSPPEYGELSTIYVEPGEWGRGCGRALLGAAIERAKRRKFHCVTLWVLESNERARRFYDVAGFRTDGARKTEEPLEDVMLHEVRCRMEVESNGQ